MLIINVASPLTFILVTIATILLIFLGHEIKKSYVAVIPLLMHLGFLIMHTIQLLTLSPEYSDNSGILTWCLVVDFGFILVSFLAYLWVDDIEAKAVNKKSLDWLWKNI